MIAMITVYTSLSQHSHHLYTDLWRLSGGSGADTTGFEAIAAGLGTAGAVYVALPVGSISIHSCVTWLANDSYTDESDFGVSLRTEGGLAGMLQRIYSEPGSETLADGPWGGKDSFESIPISSYGVGPDRIALIGGPWWFEPAFIPIFGALSTVYAEYESIANDHNGIYQELNQM